MGEYRTTSGEKPPQTPREQRAWRRRVLWALAVVILVLLAALQSVRITRYVPASGYVTSLEYAEVRAPMAGQVTRIAAASGDRVEAGALLVQLDDAAERASLAVGQRETLQSEAQLALREANLAETRRQHACQVDAARQAAEHARQRLELTRQLAAQGLASGRDLSDQTFQVQAAEAEHRRLSETDFAWHARELEVLKQELAARQEAVTRIETAVAMRAVRSPLAGLLLRHTFYTGEVVRPDVLLFEVFGGEIRTLKLRVPERFATRVATNQTVRIQLRSYPSLWPRWLEGQVTAVRGVIQTEGQQSYRLISCEFDPGGHEIPPGSTADARIGVGKAPVWAVLFGL